MKKSLTIFALIIIAINLTSCTNQSELEELKTKYEQATSKLTNLIKEKTKSQSENSTQEAVAKLKKEFEKKVKEHNKTLEDGFQNPIEVDELNFPEVYNGLVKGIDNTVTLIEHLRERADFQGDYINWYYNNRSANTIKLAKLKVLMFEALSYQDAKYLDDYKKALDELIEVNKHSFFD